MRCRTGEGSPEVTRTQGEAPTAPRTQGPGRRQGEPLTTTHRGLASVSATAWPQDGTSPSRLTFASVGQQPEVGNHLQVHVHLWTSSIASQGRVRPQNGRRRVRGGRAGLEEGGRGKSELMEGRRSGTPCRRPQAHPPQTLYLGHPRAGHPGPFLVRLLHISSI